MSDKTKTARDATTSDGTAVPSNLLVLATQAINSAWDIHAKLVSVSGLILQIAKEAVKAADGDAGLALSMFNGSLENAETELRKAHKSEKKALEDFFTPGSNWTQYRYNIGSAIKEGFDLSRVKTESALRKIRKDAKEAKNAVSKATKQLQANFDVSKLPEGVDIAELVAQATDETTGLDMEVLEELADEAGIPRAAPDEARTQREADAIADKFIPGNGLDKPRQALSTLLRGIRVVDIEGNADRVTNLLNQAIVGLNKLVPAEAKEPTKPVEKTGSEKVAEKFNVANA